MTRNCAIAGCPLHAPGPSPYCPKHRSILRRHGHPLQTAVTVHELRRYRKEVAQRRKDNPDNPAWGILETRWERLLLWARQTLAERERGRAFNRHSAQAAHQLLALAGAVPVAVIVEAALAMFLMWAAEPRRFRSDKAFDHQLVRRVRGLADTNAGTYWNHRTQKVHRVYRDVPPRTVHVLAGHLREAFGDAGVRLAHLDEFRREAAEEEQRHLRQSLAVMR